MRLPSSPVAATPLAVFVIVVASPAAIAAVVATAVVAIVVVPPVAVAAVAAATVVAIVMSADVTVASTVFALTTDVASPSLRVCRASVPCLRRRRRWWVVLAVLSVGETAVLLSHWKWTDVEESELLGVQLLQDVQVGTTEVVKGFCGKLVVDATSVCLCEMPVAQIGVGGDHVYALLPFFVFPCARLVDVVGELRALGAHAPIRASTGLSRRKLSNTTLDDFGAPQNRPMIVDWRRLAVGGGIIIFAGFLETFPLSFGVRRGEFRLIFAYEVHCRRRAHRPTSTTGLSNKTAGRIVE